ncbi:hypothetical protein DF034_24280 [Burkholderia anthina]|nr:hypothetical protein DF034_24280 [Burkholderia anthina]
MAGDRRLSAAAGGIWRFSASPLLRFSASPLLRFSASPLLRFSAPARRNIQCVDAAPSMLPGPN